MDRKKEIAFNLSIMKEMGLEEGDRRRVIDQDTGEICCFGNKEIITPGSQSGKNSVELDLLNNSRMMNKLFMEFLDKNKDFDKLKELIKLQGHTAGTMSLLGQVMLYFSSYGLEFVDNIVGDRLGLLTNLKDEYNKVKRKQKTVMKKLQK